MVLSNSSARDLIQEIIEIRDEDRGGLDRLLTYRRGHQGFPHNINGVPAEVQAYMKMSRINMVELAVEIPTQSLYVDGYRPNAADAGLEESAGWDVWQANRMDARQTAVHRGAFTYGYSYAMVLPGEPVPVIRGYSPRQLTVVYGEDPDWPLYALHTEKNGEDHFALTLFDAEAQYRYTTEGGLTPVEVQEWDGSTGGVCPVVRFLNLEDLDEVMTSEVERLMPIQDQIDVTSFDLLVSQHFQAFLQRYIIGWDGDEGERFKASASRLWTFDDPDVKVGAFQQAMLDGYLKSRDSQAQLLAVISQTPPHHLLGDLINLSAEALAAAESGHRRKITMREVGFGESWEQTLALAEIEMGLTPDVTAQVRWRDTEARSLAQTVDALGKLAEMLGVPPEALWERVPGVTQQDIQLWKRLAEEADSLGQLTTLLTAQGLGPAPAPQPVPAANGAVPPAQ